jgi:hypothetical protein
MVPGRNDVAFRSIPLRALRFSIELRKRVKDICWKNQRISQVDLESRKNKQLERELEYYYDESPMKRSHVYNQTTNILTHLLATLLVQLRLQVHLL